MTLAAAQLWLAEFTGEPVDDRSNPTMLRDDTASRDDIASQASAHTLDALAERIQHGDAQAFTEVYVQYADRLCTYALGYVRDGGAAEDIVHDVLVALWNGRSRLQLRGSLAAYLYGAVRFAALKWMRDTRVRGQYLFAAASEGTTIVEAPDTDDPEQLRAVRRAAVLQACDQLPERCREVFLLRWRDGLSYREIGAIMGITQKTVEMQMTLAVKRLRAQLGERTTL